VRWLIGVSILSLFATLPLTLVRFARLSGGGGIDASAPAAAAAPLAAETWALPLAAALAVQAYGLVLAGRGRPGGAWLHVLVALGWIGFVLLGRVHPLPGGVRPGALDWAALAAMLALLASARMALRPPRRRW
jgi:hypothetical protein